MQCKKKNAPNCRDWFRASMEYCDALMERFHKVERCEFIHQIEKIAISLVKGYLDLAIKLL